MCPSRCRGCRRSRLVICRPDSTRAVEDKWGAKRWDNRDDDCLGAFNEEIVDGINRYIRARSSSRNRDGVFDFGIIDTVACCAADVERDD